MSKKRHPTPTRKLIKTPIRIFIFYALPFDSIWSLMLGCSDKSKPPQIAELLEKLVSWPWNAVPIGNTGLKGPSVFRRGSSPLEISAFMLNLGFNKIFGKL
jgi:hypothetical protein